MTVASRWLTLLLALLVAFGLWLLLSSGPIEPGSVALGLGVGIATVVGLAARRRLLLRRAFRRPSAARAAALIRTAPPVVPRAAWIAWSRAVVFAMYGQFAEARQAFEEAPWSQLASYERAMRPLFEALLAYLELGDWEAGVARARAAEAALKEPDVRLSVELSALYVAMGRAAGGMAEPSDLSLLRERAGNFRATPVSRALPVWALAMWAERRGEAEAGRHWAFLTRHVPYCAALLRRPRELEGLPRVEAR